MDRALVLAGDRDTPAGDLQSSLQLIDSGVLQKYGIRRVFISAYPEGHPPHRRADAGRGADAEACGGRQGRLRGDSGEPILLRCQTDNRSGGATSRRAGQGTASSGRGGTRGPGNSAQVRAHVRGGTLDPGVEGPPILGDESTGGRVARGNTGGRGSRTRRGCIARNPGRSHFFNLRFPGVDGSMDRWPSTGAERRIRAAYARRPRR